MKDVKKEIDRAVMMKNAFYYGKYIAILVILSGIFHMWQSYDLIFIPIENTQMYPSFKPKESYLGRQIHNYEELCRGDVVYYSYPHRDLDKQETRPLMFARVVGLPGDKIRYENGKVYCNGNLVQEKLEEEYSGRNKSLDEYGDQSVDVMVPKDYVYLLLDNRQRFARDIHFQDSRYLGPVLIHTLLGKIRED